MNQTPTPPRSTTLAEIAERLRRARRVLAICHIDPDGDAIGSLLGFGWLLRALPQPPIVTLACADPVPPELAYLPGTEEIIRALPAEQYDLVVTVDASDALRLGPIFKPAAYAPAPLVVIDHHVTNRFFGDLNYVDPASAATAQIMISLADALDVPIGQPAAVCLLTGIVTDTLSFRTSNTTPAVLAAAMRLIEAGADITEIADRALNRRPLNIMRLWGQALSQLHLDNGVLWTEVTQAMRDATGVPGNETGSLVSHLITADEARVAAVFNEQADGRVDINLRARKGHDVAAIALQLGGGGHPQAAGCTLSGSLAQVKAQVLPLLIASARVQPA